MKKEICYLIVLTFVMFPFLIVGLRNLANGNPHTKKGKVFFGFYNWTAERLPYWLHSALIGCPSQMPLFWLPFSLVLITFSFPEAWVFAQENVLKSALFLALSTLYASGASVVLYYNYGFLQGRDNNLKEPDYLGKFLKEHQKLQTAMDMLNARGGTEITDLFYLKEIGRIKAKLAKLEREQLYRNDSGTFNGLSPELILSKKAEIMKEVFDYVPREKLEEARQRKSEDWEKIDSENRLLKRDKHKLSTETEILKLELEKQRKQTATEFKERESERHKRISEAGFHSLEIEAHQETISKFKRELEEAKKEEEKIKVLELKLQGRDSANADLKDELGKMTIKVNQFEKKKKKQEKREKKQIAEQKKIRKAQKKALAKSLEDSKGYAKEAMEMLNEVPTSNKTKVKDKKGKQSNLVFNSGGKSTVVRKVEKPQNVAVSEPDIDEDFGDEAIDNLNNSNKNSVEEIEEI